MTNIVEQIDEQLAALLSSWDVYTTIIALILAVFVIYPLFLGQEPDTHPMLLARQARPAPVRNPRESAVYRSLESPHGFPLRSGLNVKDPGAPRYSAGRDGDLRDIWRMFVNGGEHGKGKIMTVFGKEEVVEHDTAVVSKEMNVVGRRLHGKKVALYLPNSIEYLTALFGMSLMIEYGCG